MTPKLLLTLAGAAAVALLGPSCSIVETPPSAIDAYHAYDRPARLPKNPDDVHVKVSLSRQRTYVMEGPEILLSMPVSVGTPEEPTPTGNFTILNKSENQRAHDLGYAFKGGQVRKVRFGNTPPGWSFKGTPLPYWCGFKTHYGFHTGWVKHHPCTNGCIRMHENLAPKFYRLVKVGTPVNIAYSQPEDATHGTIPLPPDAGPLPDFPGSMYIGDDFFKRHKPPVFE